MSTSKMNILQMTIVLINSVNELYNFPFILQYKIHK